MNSIKKSLVHKNFLWIQYQGRIYKIDCAKKALSRVSGSEGAGGEEQALVAPFTCKVVKIHAKTGVGLKKGDPVISVEAMKMEYTYNSPRDGVVDKILVNIGQIVNEGALFIEWSEKK